MPYLFSNLETSSLHNINYYLSSLYLSLSSLLQCAMPHTDYHVGLIPFPVVIWYAYFRFRLILNGTFEGSSHIEVRFTLLTQFLYIESLYTVTVTSSSSYNKKNQATFLYEIFLFPLLGPNVLQVRQLDQYNLLCFSWL